MAWLVLVVAGLFEVGWATAMKLSEGFSRLGASVATVLLMLLSVVLLGFAMRSLPLGTAYTVWTGIGAVGSVLVGMLFLGESKDLLRLLFIALIVAGILGLKWTSPE